MQKKTNNVPYRLPLWAVACISFYPISKDHLCATFGLMYDLYSRAASNQEWPMMARIRYLKFDHFKLKENNYVLWHLSLPTTQKKKVWTGLWTIWFWQIVFDFQKLWQFFMYYVVATIWRILTGIYRNENSTTYVPK